MREREDNSQEDEQKKSFSLLTTAYVKKKFVHKIKSSETCEWEALSIISSTYMSTGALWLRQNRVVLCL